MTEIIVVERLHKVFRTQSIVDIRHRTVYAVRDVSFTVNRGKVLGIVGESGSGKTTLARAMLFLDPPTSGTVRFDGTDLGELSARARRQFRKRVQIVFQDPNSALNPRLRVRQSIAEGLRFSELPRLLRRDRIAELLEMVGIPADRMEHYPHEFSGGQKQRIVIARALSVEPEVLILDEPVSNLDVSIQAQIMNLLLKLKEQLDLTYLFISHDLNLVGYAADDIGVMKDGELVDLFPADRISAGPHNPYTEELFRSAPMYVDKRLYHHDLQRRTR